MSELRVAALASTPVKGLRILRRAAISLQAQGVAGDRRFMLVDGEGRLVNAKQVGALHQVESELRGDGELELRMPAAHCAARPVRGTRISVAFFSRTREAWEIEGPFAQALSEHAGRPLRLVEPVDGNAVDRGREGAVSLVGSASIAALAGVAGERAIDARRFRMAVEVEGSAPFAEDSWVGRELAVGEARVRIRGHVGRCLVTGRDPDSGVADLPTLELLRELRGEGERTEPLALGTYGEVLVPGTVRVGDAVALL